MKMQNSRMLIMERSDEIMKKITISILIILLLISISISYGDILSWCKKKIWTVTIEGELSVPPKIKVKCQSGGDLECFPCSALFK